MQPLGGRMGEQGAHFTGQRGDRIAQFLVMPVLHPVLEFVTTLDATERGEGGFGSSGT